MERNLLTLGLTVSIVLLSALLLLSNPAPHTGEPTVKATTTRAWLDVGLGGNEVGFAMVLEPNLFFEQYGFGFRILSSSIIPTPFPSSTSFSSVYPTIGRGWRWETLFLMLQTGVGKLSVVGSDVASSSPALLVEGKFFGNSQGKETSGIGGMIYAEATVDSLYKGAAFFIRF
jgi:hypothetical protein